MLEDDLGMTLFQEWRRVAWRELCVWPSAAMWTRGILPGVAAGSLGVGAAVGLLRMFPKMDSRIVSWGLIGTGGGLMLYELVSHWRSWSSRQISRAQGDLFVLAQDLTTTTRRPLSIEKFCSGVQYILETRYGPADREERLLYVIGCAVLLKDPGRPWTVPELLAEPLFDPLFPLERGDPLQVWQELRARILDGFESHVWSEDVCQTLDEMLPGVRRRHLEFLQRAATRCAVYKQDLMAAAWHPRRVEAWINQDRWDLLTDE